MKSQVGVTVTTLHLSWHACTMALQACLPIHAHTGLLLLPTTQRLRPSPHAFPTHDYPLRPAVWSAAGMRFIFGLNFYQMNVSLAMRQMDAILDHLPRQAVLAFEVGNEVSATPLTAWLAGAAAATLVLLMEAAVIVSSLANADLALECCCCIAATPMLV